MRFMRPCVASPIGPRDMSTKWTYRVKQVFSAYSIKYLNGTHTSTFHTLCRVIITKLAEYDRARVLITNYTAISSTDTLRSIGV